MSQSTTFPTAPHSDVVGVFNYYVTGAYVVGAYDLADLVGQEGATRHPWKLDETAGLVMVWFVPARPSRSPYDRGPCPTAQYLLRYRQAGEYSAREVAWASEPTALEVARVAREALARHDRGRASRGECDTLTPGRDAEESASVFFRAHRLSVADLLRDPDFLRLAREAAKAGKKFTAELLQWERKPVVMEAVAIVAAEVAEERRVEAERQAAVLAAHLAQVAREKPTRDAVLAAYRQCGYRTCTQGHEVHVRIGTDTAAGATGKVSKGEQYSSSCTYRKQESTHILSVRADWLERVASRDLTIWDGRLVLDATLLGHTSRGEALYSLLLARQGRGTSLETERVRVALTADGASRAVPARETCTEYTDEGVAHDALIDAGLTFPHRYFDGVGELLVGARTMAAVRAQ